MSDLPQTSTGKIARLPARLREEVNRRLHDGESGPVLLEWLNGTPEALEVCADYFNSEPISPQNLSAWRQGQFQRWEREQKQLQRTRARAEYSHQLAKASGGNLAEGALAQLTGEVLEMVEEIADLREAGQKINPDLIQAVNKSLVAARAKELETHDGRRKDLQLQQKERELALAESKFQRETAELFMKFYADAKAREIMESKASTPVKMDGLVHLIFGARPQPVTTKRP